MPDSVQIPQHRTAYPDYYTRVQGVPVPGATPPRIPQQQRMAIPSTPPWQQGAQDPNLLRELWESPGSFGRGVAASYAGTATAIPGLAGMVGNTLGIDPLAQAGLDARESLERNLALPFQPVGRETSWSSPQKYFYLGGTAMGSMSQAMGVAALATMAGATLPVAGGLAAGFLGFGPEAEQSYWQSIEAGNSKASAASHYLATGAGTTALELASGGGSRLLRGPAKEALKGVNRIPRPIRIGVGEAVEESAQGLFQQGVGIVGGYADPSELFDGLPENAVAGLLGGGGMSVVQSIYDKSNKKTGVEIQLNEDGTVKDYKPTNKKGKFNYTDGTTSDELDPAKELSGVIFSSEALKDIDSNVAPEEVEGNTNVEYWKTNLKDSKSGIVPESKRSTFLKLNNSQKREAIDAVQTALADRKIKISESFDPEKIYANDFDNVLSESIYRTINDYKKATGRSKVTGKEAGLGDMLVRKLGNDNNVYFRKKGGDPSGLNAKFNFRGQKDITIPEIAKVMLDENILPEDLTFIAGTTHANQTSEGSPISHAMAENTYRYLKKNHEGRFDQIRTARSNAEAAAKKSGKHVTRSDAGQMLDDLGYEINSDEIAENQDWIDSALRVYNADAEKSFVADIRREAAKMFTPKQGTDEHARKATSQTIDKLQKPSKGKKATSNAVQMELDFTEAVADLEVEQLQEQQEQQQAVQEEDRVQLEQEILDNLKSEKKSHRNSIRRYDNDFLKEEYEALPKYYRSRRATSPTLDDAASEAGFNSDIEFRDYLIGLDEKISTQQSKIKALKKALKKRKVTDVAEEVADVDESQQEIQAIAEEQAAEREAELAAEREAIQGEPTLAELNQMVTEQQDAEMNKPKPSSLPYGMPVRKKPGKRFTKRAIARMRRLFDNPQINNIEIVHVNHNRFGEPHPVIPTAKLSRNKGFIALNNKGIEAGYRKYVDGKNIFYEGIIPLPTGLTKSQFFAFVTEHERVHAATGLDGSNADENMVNALALQRIGEVEKSKQIMQEMVNRGELEAVPTEVLPKNDKLYDSGISERNSVNRKQAKVTQPARIQRIAEDVEPTEAQNSVDIADLKKVGLVQYFESLGAVISDRDVNQLITYIRGNIAYKDLSNEMKEVLKAMSNADIGKMVLYLVNENVVDRKDISREYVYDLLEERPSDFIDNEGLKNSYFKKNDYEDTMAKAISQAIGHYPNAASIMEAAMDWAKHGNNNYQALDDKMQSIGVLPEDADRLSQVLSKAYNLGVLNEGNVVYEDLRYQINNHILNYQKHLRTLRTYYKAYEPYSVETEKVKKGYKETVYQYDITATDLARVSETKRSALTGGPKMINQTWLSLGRKLPYKAYIYNYRVESPANYGEEGKARMTGSVPAIGRLIRVQDTKPTEGKGYVHAVVSQIEHNNDGSFNVTYLPVNIDLLKSTWDDVNLKGSQDYERRTSIRKQIDEARSLEDWVNVMNNLPFVAVSNEDFKQLVTRLQDNKKVGKSYTARVPSELIDVKQGEQVQSLYKKYRTGENPDYRRKKNWYFKFYDRKQADQFVKDVNEIYMKDFQRLQDKQKGRKIAEARSFWKRALDDITQELNYRREKGDITEKEYDQLSRSVATRTQIEDQYQTETQIIDMLGVKAPREFSRTDFDDSMPTLDKDAPTVDLAKTNWILRAAYKATDFLDIVGMNKWLEQVVRDDIVKNEGKEREKMLLHDTKQRFVGNTRNNQQRVAHHLAVGLKGGADLFTARVKARMAEGYNEPTSIEFVKELEKYVDNALQEIDSDLTKPHTTFFKTDQGLGYSQWESQLEMDAVIEQYREFMTLLGKTQNLEQEIADMKVNGRPELMFFRHLPYKQQHIEIYQRRMMNMMGEARVANGLMRDVHYQAHKNNGYVHRIATPVDEQRSAGGRGEMEALASTSESLQKFRTYAEFRHRAGAEQKAKMRVYSSSEAFTDYIQTSLDFLLMKQYREELLKINAPKDDPDDPDLKMIMYRHEMDEILKGMSDKEKNEYMIRKGYHNANDLMQSQDIDPEAGFTDLGYRKFRQAPGLAVYYKGGMRVPWVHGSIYNILKDLYTNHKLNNGIMQGLVRLNSLQKRMVMPVAYQYIGNIITIPSLKLYSEEGAKGLKRLKPSKRFKSTILKPLAKLYPKRAWVGAIGGGVLGGLLGGPLAPYTAFAGTAAGLMGAMYTSKAGKDILNGIEDPFSHLTNYSAEDLKELNVALSDGLNAASTSWILTALYDDFNRVEKNPHNRTSWENMKEFLSTKGGLDQRIFGNYVTRVLFETYKALKRGFLAKGYTEVEAGRMAAKMANDGGGTLQSNLYGAEGPLLSLLMFAKDFNMTFFRVLTGAFYPMWQGLHGYRTGIASGTTNALLHAESTKAEMQAMWKEYAKILATIGAFKMVAMNLIQLGLSYFDEDEEERGKMLIDPGYFTGESDSFFENEPGREMMLRLPMRDQWGNEIYADSIIGREWDQMWEVFSDKSRRFTNPLTGSSRQFFPITMVPLLGSYWDGKNSLVMQLAADFMTGKDYKGSSITNPVDHFLQSFLPQAYQTDQIRPGGPVFNRASSLVGFPLKRSFYDRNSFLSFAQQEMLERASARIRAQDEKLRNDRRTATKAELKMMQMTGQISPQQMVNDFQRNESRISRILRKREVRQEMFRGR